jgi:hypothetical protein
VQSVSEPRQISDAPPPPCALGGGWGAPQIDADVDRVAVNVGELIRGEIEVVEGGDVLLELRDAAGPDQRGSDSRVTQSPGDGHLGEGLASSKGDLVERSDEGEVVVVDRVSGK